MNDWIEWNGGECPVKPGTLVTVKLRGGILGEVQESVLSDRINWDHAYGNADIIAYRVEEQP